MSNIITVLVAIFATNGRMLALSLNRNRRPSGEKKKAIKIAEDLVILQAKKQRIQKEIRREHWQKRLIAVLFVVITISFLSGCVTDLEKPRLP